jgi:hypothetical protein
MTEIIRLREQEASVNNQNGDFKVVLDKPLTLKNGDELAIKSVFLDTMVAGGQLIELDADVDVSIDVVRYIVNDDADQTFADASRFKSYAPAPDLANGDGLLYFDSVTNATTAQTEKVKSIRYRPFHRTDHMVGGLDVKFNYTEPTTGATKSFTFRIKREKAGLYPKDGKTEDVSVLCEGQSFALATDRDFVKSHGINPDDFNVDYDAKPGNGLTYAVPNILTFTHTIPAGIYTPTEISELLTDEMIKLDSLGAIGRDLTNDVYPVNNAFLRTVCQNDKLATVAGVTACYQEGNGAKFIRFANVAKMKTDNEDRFVGANQVQLAFDDAHKKMSFPILHFPIYVNETAAGNDALPGLKYEDHGIVSSSGGCAFVNMSPPDFWAKLGFENMCVKPEQQAAALATNGVAGFGANVIPYKIPAILGANITSGFSSLDTPVQKNANFRNPNPNGSISTSATTPILGTKTFKNDYSNEGYYYIELSAGLTQSLVGARGDVGFSSNKIHSIVGTYFQSDNFTSDTGAGSIAYKHVGEPQILSNFGVRILDCNGNVPDETLIGHHNTVFIEHVKAVPNQMK